MRVSPSIEVVQFVGSLMSLALEATAEIAECIARALFASLMLMPCSVSGARVIFFMRPGPDSSAGMMRSFFSHKTHMTSEHI